jgi:hypothetical protein
MGNHLNVGRDTLFTAQVPRQNSPALTCYCLQLQMNQRLSAHLSLLHERACESSSDSTMPVIASVCSFK